MRITGFNFMPTILLLLLISSAGFAQRTLNGLVVSKKDGKSIPGAAAFLAKTGDSLILRTAITDNDGKFSMVIDGDFINYQIKVSSIGFDAQVVTLKDTLATLRIMLLESAAIALNSVQVVAKQPVIERKIDRTVLNVENSIALIGGDALDAVSKAPGVRVGIDNSISLIGKSGVRVMVNDRLVTLSGEDLVNMLKSIPSDNLSRVEVITNPPAKYDAAGNAGLINIVTKRNPMKGFTGNGRLGYVKTKFPAENAGLNLSYNTQKWSTTAIANAGYGHVFSTNGKETLYPNQSWQEEAGNKNTNKNLSGSFGLEFKPSAKQLFAFKIDHSYSDQSRKSRSTTIVLPYSGNKVDSTVVTNSKTPKVSNSTSVNLHHELKLDTLGTKVFTDIDYFNFDRTAEQDYTSQTFVGSGNTIINGSSVLNGSPQRVRVLGFRSDLELPVKWAKLSGGIKASGIDNSSSFAFFRRLGSSLIADPEQSYDFNYREQTFAAYLSGNRNFGKLEFQLGLRAEHTRIRGILNGGNADNRSNYTKLFPTFYLLYKLGNEKSLRLNYGRRINRPEYSRLNPFRTYTSPYAYSEGNPFLQPSFSNNVELSFDYKDWFSTQFYYSRSVNGFDQIGIPDPNTNIIGIVQRNFFSTDSYGINQSVNFSLGKGFESYNYASVYYSATFSADANTQRKVSGWGAYLSSDNTMIWNADKTLMSNLSFWYQFPEASGIDKVRAYYSIDVGTKVLLAKKKIMLGVVATDIFKTNKVNFRSITNGIVQDYSGYGGSQSLRVSLSYRFGKSQKSKREKEGSSSDQEKERTN